MAEEDRYRLAPVRDARERDERVRRGELAAAVGDARVTAAQLEALSARVGRARDRLTAALAAGTTGAAQASASRLALAERFIARCRRDLADALAEELRAATAHDARLGAVDGARLTLARARADREVLERHFGRWREARKKLAERRED